MNIEKMKTEYINNQKAQVFLIGFNHKGLCYSIMLNPHDFIMLCKQDKTSKKYHRQDCLRFKPTRTQKQALINEYINKQDIILCDTEKLFKGKKQGENCGHVFERMTFEKYNGQKCEKQFWYNGGDFIVYNELKEKYIVQAKFEYGTVCNESQIAKICKG